MAQTWTANCFQADHEAQTDLTNMEANFATLLTLFSGATAPGTMAACHPWFDTAKHVLKVRDDGDSAWVGLMHADTSQKLWVYRDSAPTGWAVDGTPTDRVLALKGGSTYTTGGANAGTWTQPSHSHTPGTFAIPAHNHQWHKYTQGMPGPQTYNSGGSLWNIDGSGLVHDYAFDVVGLSLYSSTYKGLNNAYTDNEAAASVTGTSATSATVNTWRPAASVGTLQYLDL